MNSSWFDTSNEYIKYRIELTVNSQDQASNYSNVTVRVFVHRTNTGYETYGNGTCYCTIDGTRYSQAISSSQKITNAGIYIFEKTLNISHVSDGSKVLFLSASISHSRFTASDSAYNAILPTIARSSSFTVGATRTLGSANVIAITKADSAFTHTVTWTCGSQSGTIATQTTATSLSWTPAISLASQNTDGDGVSITISCTAYNGSTVLGTTSQSVSFAIPTSAKPTCSISISDVSGCYGNYGIYVQGKSRLKITVTPTLSYGSSIVSYSITANGSTYAAQTCTTGVLSSTGTIQITATVTDGRGRSGTASKSVSVVSYEPPSIKKLLITRCNANGAENFEGEYGKIEFSAVVSSMSGKNVAKYSVSYTPTSGSGGGSQNLTAYSNNFAPSGSVIVPMSSSYAYDVVFTATDSFTSVSLKTSASTGFALIHWGADGRTIAFGKVSEHTGEAEFGMPIRLTGGLVHIPIPDGSDFNDLTTPGFYVGDVDSGGYANCPFGSGRALLEVHSLGLNGDILQVYTTQYATYNQAMRRVRQSGTWTAWYHDRPNATIPVNKGGTGQTTFNSGGILRGNGTSVITSILGVGALFAETSGSPEFGVLPASCGGTGYDNIDDFKNSLNINVEKAFTDLTDCAIGSGTIKIGNVRITIGSVSAVSMKGAITKSISFSGFSSAPIVVASPYCTATAASGYALSAYIMSVSTTSASVRVSSNYTSSLSVGLRWIAIGVAS